MFYTLLVTAYAFPSNIKGVQIKNNGKDKLWIVMTGEDGFVLPGGQMVSEILVNFDNVTQF